MQRPRLVLIREEEEGPKITVDLNETMCGISLLTIRSVLRRCEYVDSRRFAKKCDITKEHAEKLLHALREQGYIKEDDSGYYRRTTKGCSLGMAKMVKRISREKAEKLLSEVIARAHVVNQVSSLTSYIKEIKLFGSLLHSEGDVGDIDIAIEYERREGFQEFISQQRKSGKWLPDDLFDHDLKIGKFLKNRNPYISPSYMWTFKALKCQGKTVFVSGEVVRWVERTVGIEPTTD